jgi:RNA polymerase sigma-70 factor (ECF subfamily)
MMTHMAESIPYDPELTVVVALQRGDGEAFRELLRRQDRWVRGVVFAILGDAQRVDDVAQQVWTTVWEQARDLRDVRLWKPWLYRLARNAALDAGRETTRRRAFTDRLLRRVPEEPSAPPPEDHLVANERERAVLTAIQALPAMYREPFALRHLEGWTYRQISELLELPVDTVETRLVRARRMLRDALEGKLA